MPDRAQIKEIEESIKILEAELSEEKKFQDLLENPTFIDVFFGKILSSDMEAESKKLCEPYVTEDQINDINLHLSHFRFLKNHFDVKKSRYSRVESLIKESRDLIRSIEANAH